MKESEFRTIGILGMGTIGAGLACFYASKGMKVRLFDINKECFSQGLTMAKRFLEHLQQLGLIDSKTIEKAHENLLPVNSMEALLIGADFIHESTTERYDTKKEVFSLMDNLAIPSTVIASSSSGLLMSEIQKVMKNPERSLIAHPFNPPHLIPLVELVPGKQTAPETIKRMYDFFEAMGKIPVTLKKELPGHIANRLAAALWREAIDLVACGVASVEDVDKALYAGPGLRWSFMGQHLIYHLGGGAGGYEYFIEHIGKTFEEYWKDMATWTQIPESAKKSIVSGVKNYVGGQSLSDLTKWRDGKLARVIKALYETSGI